MPSPVAEVDPPRGPLRALLGGALVGAVFGLVIAHAGLGRLAPLQVGSQAVFCGALALGSCAVGALAACLFALALGRSARRAARSPSSRSAAPRPWPGWAALAVLAGLELHLDLEPSDLAAPAHAGVVLASALALLLVLAWAGRRWPMLESPVVWSTALLALLGAVLLRIGRTPAMQQGAPGFGVWTWAPLALLGVGALGLGRRPRGARAGALLALFLFASAAFVWTRAAARHGAPRSARPNLLLITVDTLRADHVGCYGSREVRTPHIDALAAEGALWEHAISPIPTTNPAHSSLFTGLYPGNHGVINNAPYAFFPGVLTLPELCEQSGYSTVAFVSGYTLKRDLSRLFRRFQVYDDVFGFLRWVPSEWRDTSLPILAKRLAPAFGLRLRLLDERFDRRADDLVDAVLDWLARNGDGPFCLWLHFYDPHMPYDPPAPFDGMYGEAPGADYEPNWYDFDPDRRERAVLGGQALERFRDLYAGEVSFVDEQLGRLFAALRADGLWERTAILLTSDHGESLGEHDYYFDHSYFLYDTCLRVPLIARFPDVLGGLGRGVRIPEQVQLVDVLPTLTEALGLESLEGLDGVSLLPRLRGAPAPSETAPALSVTYEFRITHQKRLLSVRTDRHKYVRTSYQWDEFVRRPEREELYDLTVDPDELQDLAPSAPELVARFRELSRAEWERWGHELGKVDAELTDRDRERLRALGYY